MQDMPAKYIYEPWTAPLAVQQAAGCVIGRDYPAPIVDHAAASKANMAKMKAAYDAAKQGGGSAEGGGVDEDEKGGVGDGGRTKPKQQAAKRARK